MSTKQNQVMDAKSLVEAESNAVNEKDFPGEIKVVSKKIPEETEIAKELFKIYGANMVRTKEDIFKWVGTHWIHVGDDERISMIHQIQEIEPRFGNQRAKNTLATFTGMLDLAPHNLFTPNPWRVNLLNGTIHIIPAGEGKYRTDFQPHNQKDFCTNLIPITFEPLSKNQEFVDMIKRVAVGVSDQDSEQKFQAIRQMYGACLAPIYPRLFMIYGVAGTGKSSVIIPLTKLMDPENTAYLPPTELKHGNLLESIAGKLVNIDPDIPYNATIDDAVIKRIEDRVPLTINRKYKTSLSIPLPAVHVFGGNDIPSTADRGSGAHRRRWTFLGFHTNVLPVGEYDRKYSEKLFYKNPAGVLNFALEGLAELLNNHGTFTQPVSGAAKMEEWIGDSDPVGSWLADCAIAEAGDLELGDGVVLRSQVWANFCLWHKEARNRESRLGKKKLFRILRDKKKYEWVDFNGIGRCVSLDEIVNNKGSFFSGFVPCVRNSF